MVRSKRFRVARTLGAAVIGAMLLLGSLAGVNSYLAAVAERATPATGQFLAIEGVELHYTVHGEGPPLVLLHGNGAMVEDFQSSGLVDRAAKRFRVIAFDRPGFGHSSRPRDRDWTPAAQAELIRTALTRLGVSRALVLGHSWGALVAVTLALDHPDMVRALVLEAGYFYPSGRPDVALVHLIAQPGLVDLLSYTVTPLSGRLMWTPMIREVVFAPAAVTPGFAAFPEAMALRPSQLLAATEEVALLNAGAADVAARYGTLAMPVAILVGAGDHLIDPASQSVRLHGDVRQSTLRVISPGGHMLHHTAPDAVMAAIDEVAALAPLPDASAPSPAPR